MANSKIVLAGLLGAFALTYVMAGVASAEPTKTCESVGSKPTLTEVCLETLQKTLLTLGLPGLETLELLAIQVPADPHLLTATVGGAEIKLSCIAAAFTGIVDGTPEGSASIPDGEVIFKECTVTKPLKCIILSAGGVEGEIAWQLLVGTITEEDGDLTLLPSVGTLFASFKIDSKAGESCAIENNKLEITAEGTGPLGLVANFEEDKEDHNLVFASAGNLLLQLGEESGTFTMSSTFEVLLDKPPAWSSTTWTKEIPWSLLLTEIIS